MHGSPPLSFNLLSFMAWTAIWTQVVTGFLPLSSVRFGKAGWQLMGRIRLKIKSNHLSNHSVDGVADSNALICFDLTWSIWRKMFQYIFTQPFSVLKVLMRTKGCVIFYVKLIRDRRMRKKYRDRGFTSFANNASGVFFKKYDERSIKHFTRSSFHRNIRSWLAQRVYIISWDKYLSM